jgi:hypothetical protein
VAAHRFALRSIQTLADLQELPLYLDASGLFHEEIARACRLDRGRFTGSLVRGVSGDLREVWVTSNPKPELMTARYKRVL